MSGPVSMNQPCSIFKENTIVFIVWTMVHSHNFFFQSVSVFAYKWMDAYSLHKDKCSYAEQKVDTAGIVFSLR